jgi:hypothetical protein
MGVPSINAFFIAEKRRDDVLNSVNCIQYDSMVTVVSVSLGSLGLLLDDEILCYLRVAFICLHHVVLGSYCVPATSSVNITMAGLHFPSSFGGTESGPHPPLSALSNPEPQNI